MSSYANYDRLAPDYDLTREAVGLDIIREQFAANAKPASQTLLDAGCGSGNYSAALWAEFAHTHAFDLNPQMLARARTRLAAAIAARRLTLRRASLEALPLDDRSVDSIMVNQVLHHIAADSAHDHRSVRRVFREFERVLKVGGTLLINTCSRRQLRSGFWYYSLIPQARAAMCQRHLLLHDLRRLLRECGLSHQRNLVPPALTLQGDALLDGHGPLNPAWRAGDSIWSTVPPAQLRRVEQRITALAQRNQLDAFVRTADAARARCGQMTFVIANKCAE